MSTVQTGKISLNPRGFGFIRTVEGNSIFVTAAGAKNLISGDTVTFEERVDPRTEKAAAHNVRLLKGNDSLLLGTIEYSPESGVARLFTEDFNNVPLFVESSTIVNADVVVAARIIAASRKGGSVSNVTVRVERVLGHRGADSFGPAYALARNDLCSHFPQSVVMEAHKVSNELDKEDGRQDLRQIPFVTIDGEETKDIDDAVYVQKTEKGFEVYVGIADVSAFVRPGSLLDKEAQARGTSVYLPGNVVPMLPLALSAGVCSLGPNVDRKAVVLHMTTDESGNVLSHKFLRAKIRSNGALTYAGVAAFLDSGDHSKLPPLTSAVFDSLRAMQELHERLVAVRESKGRLDLDAPHVSVVKARDRRWKLVVEERNTAERIIESMMLLANATAAHHLTLVHKAGIFRFQEAPSEEQWKAMNAQLQEVYGVSCQGETPSVPELLRLMENFEKGSEPYSVIQGLFQSLVPRAQYSAQAKQHFSLNALVYTQFTSPIRRYADLMVHRLVLGEVSYSEDELNRLAAACTDLSSRAGFAEGDLNDKAKKYVYLEDNADLAPEARPVEQGIVLRCTPKGVRLRIPARQFTAVIPEATLLSTGHYYDEGKERWVRESGFPVLPGCLYNVVLDSWRETNSSYDLTLAIHSA